MRLIVEHAGRRQEVVVDVHTPRARVADLLAALRAALPDAALLDPVPPDPAPTDPTPGEPRQVAGVEVDGVALDPGAPVLEVGLYEGACLVLAAGPSRSPATDASTGGSRRGDGARAVGHRTSARQRGHPRLVVTDGPVAGRAWDLDVGVRVVLGRCLPPQGEAGLVLDDLTVSAQHAALSWRDGRGWVRDLGSANGTWVDAQPVVAGSEVPVDPGQVLRLGATHLMLEGPGSVPSDTAVVAARPEPGATTVPLHRTPRPWPPPPPAAVRLPAPPPARSPARTLPLTAIVAPLLLAGALVWWTGNARFALFLLLSPVMALGTWWSSRRGRRRETRRDARAVERDLHRLAADLAVLVDTEVARRRRWLPDLAEVTRRVTTPSQRLWERRACDPDWLWLRLGVGAVRWDPPLQDATAERAAGGPHRPHTAGPADADRPHTADPAGTGQHPTDDDEVGWVRTRIDAEVARAATLPHGPVGLCLDEVVGVVGDAALARGVVRALLLQAAAHHGPADLEVAVLTTAARARHWSFVRWLPHLRGRGDTEVAFAAGDVEVERLARQLRAAARPVARLVVVDDATLVTAGAQLRGLLRDDTPGGALVLATEESLLPAVVRTVVALDGGLGRARLLRTGTGISPPARDADDRRPARQRDPSRLAPQTSGSGVLVDELVVAALPEVDAERLARLLARFEDPERVDPHAQLPAEVRLRGLLVADEDEHAGAEHDVLARTVLAAWRNQPGDPAPAAPLGVGRDGVVAVDLVRDGPHGLVVGTTGAGKSELLRSLVVGLAARVDPDHLSFVLVDYKGGSAFDRCAELPHTVGVLTDLDEHLADRVLRSLEAELRHRERVLRAAGVSDLPGYLAAGAPRGPLPRLVVVVDEFATLAAELPDVLGALIGVAQRGRSLGMHLLLATQRPGGALHTSITANTDLRIALRVQTSADSSEVVGQPDAAGIPRDRPGRAYIRTGPDRAHVVQTARVSAPSIRARPPVSVQVIGAPGAAATTDTATRTGQHTAACAPAGANGAGATGPAGAAAETPSDLDVLVEAIAIAARRAELAPPRVPWLPPLPDQLSLAAARASGDHGGPDAPSRTGARRVVLGLSDDPDAQRRLPVCWDRAAGHLGIFGMVGSGTTTALRTVVTALAGEAGPDRLHIHVLDQGSGGLEDLARLPVVGSVVGPTDTERRSRLLRALRRELQQRRASPGAPRPEIVVLVDGIGTLLAELDPAAGAGADAAAADALQRLLVDGPDVGITLVLAGARIGELPLRTAALVARRLLLRHADASELLMVGQRGTTLPRFVPGRGIDEQGREIQLALPDALPDLPVDVDVALSESATPGSGVSGVSGVSGASCAPLQVRCLPRNVEVDTLPSPYRDGSVLWLPVGCAEEDLAPAALRLAVGGQALVAGAARRGVSTALRLLAEQARRADPDLVLVGIDRPGGVLYTCEHLDAAGPLTDLARLLAAAPTDPRCWLVLVDDAAVVEDRGGVLSGLVEADRVCLVAGARAAELRGGVGHWTRALRRQRSGLLLAPDPAVDADLLGISLPRHTPVDLAVSGRGFVVDDGEVRLAQLAQPPVVHSPQGIRQRPA